MCDQFKCINSVSDIEKLNTALTYLLLIASNEITPTKNFNTKVKPYWTSKERETFMAAHDKHTLWINEDRPRGMEHESYRNYKDTNILFTNTQNYAY